jgi:hypothetical protein
MSDVVNIGPKPEPEFKLSPEREREIYESSMKAGRKIADVLVFGMSKIADAKMADHVSEVEALKVRVERLERLLVPREVGASIGE